MTLNSAVHVAVGVVRDGDGNILLTQRAKHAHQGGLWEFPGGKLEGNETVFQALCRELQEEVGLAIQTAKPLIKINHRYPDLQVLLDVWQVTDFSGVAKPCEGQAMRWVAPQQLADYPFPDANVPIITASRLPDHYAILEGNSITEISYNLGQIIKNRVSLLQLRIKTLPASDMASVCHTVLSACQQHNIKVLINSDVPILSVLSADGIHLTSHDLLACRTRPSHEWVAASCHNLQELQHAERIGIDFVVLAPILPTSTHPEAKPLGWESMSDLIEQVNLPVYALGGLGLDDMDQVLNAGGQGIAGISAFIK